MLKFEDLEKPGTIVLPYPPAALNPNKKKGHWGNYSRPFKKYKNDCRLSALGKPVMLRFRITFHPAINRRRDRDNAIAAFKAGQDGLAAAWKIDDSEFEIEYAPKFGELVKGGAVVIEPLGGDDV